MGALTQRQEAVTSSKEELQKRILHHTLCFITFFQRTKEQLKLSSHSSKAKSRLRIGVLKHFVRKSNEEIEDKLEQEKSELPTESSAFTTGEKNSEKSVSSDLRTEVDSTEKNKRRIFNVVVSVGKTLITSSLSKVYAKSKDVDALRSEIQALNKSLQKQEEEKLQMRQELNDFREQVLNLMEHVGFVCSSSRPS